MIFNSQDLSISLPDRKVSSVKALCAQLSNGSPITLRDIASILGQFSWAISAVPYAQAHYRNLQAEYTYNAARKNLKQKITLSPAARADLSWWIMNLELVNGRTIFPSKPDVEIHSDASLTGWGAVSNGTRTRGPWTSPQLGSHINELELWAAFFGLQSFANHSSSISVSLFMDNMTAVCYLNKGGGTKSKRLSNLASQIIAWCEKRSITLQATFLPGRLNSIADAESRSKLDASDWRLDPLMFSRINKMWTTEVDLFASAWNSQLEKFVSWSPQPGAWAVNCFSLNWSGFTGYAFPPFNLITKCLGKIIREKAEAIMITPLWPGQPWFPLLLESSCEVPRILPQDPNLIRDPTGAPHPLLATGALKLAVWKLSGQTCKTKAFRNRLSNCSLQQTVQQPGRLTNPLGGTGVIGVFDKTPIPYLWI